MNCMNHRNKKLAKYRSALADLFATRPDAYRVANRYRVMRSVLLQEYIDVGVIEKEVMLEMLKDITFLDREIRLFTQGHEDELKDKLSAEKIVELKS